VFGEEASVTDPPGLDVKRLQAYLEREHPGLLGGTVSASLFDGGRSNLTYALTDGEAEIVLRRPPLGHVLPTAHDMVREFRMQRGLAGSAVPVPRTLLLCDDPTIIGAPFYLMELVHGTVYRSGHDTAQLAAHHRANLADQLVDVLAELHAVDPMATGLADLGRPDGYLERQVRRWSRQLDQSRSRDLPGIDKLRDRLARQVPVSCRSGVVHGDYRLDNVIVGDDLRVRAVLDWEMATIGDPLADVGLLIVYWDGLTDVDNPITTGMGVAAGFPAGEYLAARYASRSGVDVSHLDWYIALGYFKVAVILEGIHFRYVHGQTVGAGFDRVGDLVPLFIEGGLAQRLR
jgi:aminoglycoside phosphotransferase (APT) family kinase protein